LIDRDARLQASREARNRSLVLLIFGIFFAAYGALNYYIGLRGWQYLFHQVPFLNPGSYWIAFTIVVLVGTAATVANRFLPQLLRRTLYLAGSYWLAAMTYFILVLLFFDLVRVLDRWTGVLPGAVTERGAFSLAPGLLAVGTVLVLLAYGTGAARKVHIAAYEITIPKPAGQLDQLRIAMVSDLHLGPVDDQRQKRVIEILNELKPDLVVIPGDIVDDSRFFAEENMAADFHQVQSKYGIYAAFGNHDYFNRDLDQVTKLLNQAGIHVLRDSSVKIADSFYLIGRDDKYHELKSGSKNASISKLTNGLDLQYPVIMLAHQPVDLDKTRHAGVDLLLAGHTHQGQFFPFNLVTRRIFAVDYGHLEKEGLQVIVTSGAGTWGPPIRLGSTSEVVDIRLTFKAPAA